MTTQLFRSPTQATKRRSSPANEAGASARSLRPPSYGVALVDRAERSDRLPSELRATMDHAFGADFSDVRVHADDGHAARMGAWAFTQGSDIHFAPGRYRPDTERGRELIGHELAHVAQQAQGRVDAPLQAKGPAVHSDPGLEAEADARGARAARGERVADLGGMRVSGSGVGAVQCYAEQTIGSKTWRVSDDLGMAIRQDSTKPEYGSHVFFADSSLITSSSAALAGRSSRLELSAGSKTMSVTDGKTTKTLTRVVPKNLQNASSGNDPTTGMSWVEDCGFAANSIMQGDKLKTKAAFRDPDTEKKAAAAAAKLGKGATAVAKANASAASRAASSHETSTLEYGTDKVAYGSQTLHTPHMMLDQILKATLDPDPAKAWKKYRKMSAKQRDEFDRNVGINEYASPEVGEAFSIVSNKDELAKGKSAWNFHWGGVCMKSGSDLVTMENFAASGVHAWDFQMYGPASKKGQTFHEQQKARIHTSGRDEYGPNPTTIWVRPG